MWQTKYASAEPKNLAVVVNFRPCSEDYFLSGRPYSVTISKERTLVAIVMLCISRQKPESKRALEKKYSNIF